MLLPTMAAPADRPAVRFADTTLTHERLAAVAGDLATRIAGRRAVAVWATPSAHTCVAVVAGLLAGIPVVPLNPKIGQLELAHILNDSRPELVLADTDQPTGLPALCADFGTDFDGDLPPEPDGEQVAFIVYTSGTTGPPKGVLLPRRAVAASLDALAEIWDWTDADTVVHGLPLFHVHGLILGVLGPIRRGGAVHHVGKFSSRAIAAGLVEGATMVFGVPTMYSRLVADAEADKGLAGVLANARVLVSGSAALPKTVHERIAAATGQQVVERYGLTETLMNCGIRLAGERRPGTVGPPLPGVELRLVDDAGAVVEARDDETVGEIEVRGDNLFLGYLNRPDATAQAMHDGWFRTGDMATVAADGYVRIVGRKATDLIKSGGYKIGAGEIENALLEHPGVAEAAVTGEPDDDLGERIVAWVVPSGEPPSADELADHVAKLLAPHKRPRVVHFLESLPRNDMGKVTKRALGG
ncbi:acyl-CoA synthetase [Labedaea rhizosphaerae]|uniref:Malonyl-CoA/methylmalonyl-CoA synthetase n=1 Tax=Labedaea rhizosphaerae TaxID=598644 RepID=A0A4R6SQC0_LABRH|nr:acyl-CoA synthetase [Labedaea rhizosphaerae]TDQ05800.1 malonyl-CoA/methylmalonyl-CoA synthetase [Labedaea rhizosphaerae]